MAEVRKTNHVVYTSVNGQIIGTSEAYETERSCAAGIESVKRWAKEAKIKEV